MAPPVSGRWVSAPIATCPEPSAAGRSHSVSVWEPLEDEPAAHCWLVCGQSIFQVDPGNLNPVLLAEREEVRTLFSHENGGVADAVLPGFQAMPTVGFEIKRTSVGVVVELGIRSELTVTGADSRISFNGDPVERAFRPWEPWPVERLPCADAPAPPCVALAPRMRQVSACLSAAQFHHSTGISGKAAVAGKVVESGRFHLKSEPPCGDCQEKGDWRTASRLLAVNMRLAT